MINLAKINKNLEKMKGIGHGRRGEGADSQWGKGGMIGDDRKVKGGMIGKYNLDRVIRTG